MARCVPRKVEKSLYYEATLSEFTPRGEGLIPGVFLDFFAHYKSSCSVTRKTLNGGDGGADLAGEELGDWEAPSETERLGERRQVLWVRALPSLLPVALFGPTTT